MERHEDDRGFLARTFCEREFAEAGIPMRIVQSSTIHSPLRHTLRGLHYQEAPHAEAKLVRCTRGSIFSSWSTCAQTHRLTTSGSAPN